MNNSLTNNSANNLVNSENMNVDKSSFSGCQVSYFFLLFGPFLPLDALLFITSEIRAELSLKLRFPFDKVEVAITE